MKGYSKLAISGSTIYEFESITIIRRTRLRWDMAVHGAPGPSIYVLRQLVGKKDARGNYVWGHGQRPAILNTNEYRVNHIGEYDHSLPTFKRLRDALAYAAEMAKTQDARDRLSGKRTW